MIHFFCQLHGRLNSANLRGIAAADDDNGVDRGSLDRRARVLLVLPTWLVNISNVTQQYLYNDSVNGIFMVY